MGTFTRPLGAHAIGKSVCVRCNQNILEWESINGKTRCRFFFIFVLFFGKEKEKEKGYIGGLDLEKARERLDDI